MAWGPLSLPPKVPTKYHQKQRRLHKKTKATGSKVVSYKGLTTDGDALEEYRNLETSLMSKFLYMAGMYIYLLNGEALMYRYTCFVYLNF